jgi:hypothetical protein
MGWVEASEEKKKIEPHGCSVGLNLQAKPVFRHWVRCGRGETHLSFTFCSDFRPAPFDSRGSPL